MPALNELGLRTEDLLQQVITGKLPPGMESPQTQQGPTSEAAQLRKELADLKGLITQQHENRILEDHRGKIRATLESPEFELLATDPAMVEEVLELQTEWFRSYREVLPIQQAASKILEEFKVRLQGMASNQAARKILGIPDLDVDDEDSILRESRPSVPAGPPRKKLSKPQKPAPKKEPQEDVDPMDEESVIRAALKAMPPDYWSTMKDS